MSTLRVAWMLALATTALDGPWAGADDSIIHVILGKIRGGIEQGVVEGLKAAKARAEAN